MRNEYVRLVALFLSYSLNSWHFGCWVRSSIHSIYLFYYVSEYWLKWFTIRSIMIWMNFHTMSFKNCPKSNWSLYNNNPNWFQIKQLVFYERDIWTQSTKFVYWYIWWYLNLNLFPLLRLRIVWSRFSKRQNKFNLNTWLLFKILVKHWISHFMSTSHKNIHEKNLLLHLLCRVRLNNGE